ncbi:MAG: hypothetical protein R3A45_09770 [Bdellovibrionota bacterium]
MAATMLQTKLDTTFTDYSGVWVLTHSMLTDAFPSRITQNNETWEERLWMIEDRIYKIASFYTRKKSTAPPYTVTIEDKHREQQASIYDPFISN